MSALSPCLKCWPKFCSCKQPKSAAERKRDERARRAERGEVEVRGVYVTDLTPEKLEKIKKYAARLK